MFTRKLGVRPVNYSSVFGFTMIELMVAITLVGVVTALALPSYSEMIDKRKLTSSAQQLAAFINQGHTEAARRNQPVTFSYKRNNHEDWCVGAILGEVDCDCEETDSDQLDYCDIDDIKHILSGDDLGNMELVHIMEGSGSFSFDPIRGILLDPADDMFIELHTDSRDYKIKLVVNDSGNVKLCSMDADHDVPGYEVC